ncbi:MAG: hypothetical protein IKD83_01080 [Firmicutes bacterium]|nr:hypothetical protein [Bacillota bacterium]
MYSRKYYKKYVILDCETRGFGLWGKIPAGTCSLEIKNGKALITMVIQGLNPGDEDQYKLYFVFEDEDGYKGSEVCGLSINSIGSGKFKYSFDPNNVNNTGFRAEDIKAAAVISKDGKTSKSGIAAPLCGYFYDRMDWRNNFSAIKPKNNMVLASGHAVNQKNEIVPEETGTAETDESTQDSLIVNEIERMGNSPEENHAEDITGFNLIWEYAEKTEPFSEDMPVEWAKINIRQTSCLPSKNRNAVNSPRVLLSYKKAGYFVLGKTADGSDKMILLGVPAHYRQSDEGDFNQAGFYYFKPGEDVEKEEGVKGYWLLSIE